MSVVRRFAAGRLDTAAHPGSMIVGALEESGQEKKGTATAGVKRRHMGCAGGVDNGINTVHLACIRAGAGHALIGSRQWIPAEQISDPVTAITMGLPLGLAFATTGRFEETFEFGKDLFGLDQAQVRLYEAILRHTVLVMAALAICAAGHRGHTRPHRHPAPPLTHPDQQTPQDLGMIPLTIAEIKRLLNAATARTPWRLPYKCN